MYMKTLCDNIKADDLMTKAFEFGISRTHLKVSNSYPKYLILDT